MCHWFSARTPSFCYYSYFDKETGSASKPKSVQVRWTSWTLTNRQLGISPAKWAYVGTRIVIRDMQSKGELHASPDKQSGGALFMDLAGALIMKSPLEETESSKYRGHIVQDSPLAEVWQSPFGGAVTGKWEIVSSSRWGRNIVPLPARDAK